MKNLFAVSVVVILLAVIVAPMMIYHMWALSIVASSGWDWFVAPTFPSWTKPTIDQFVAALAMMVFIKAGLKSEDSDDRAKTATERFQAGVVKLLLGPWALWAGLWFMHLVWVPTAYK